MYFNNAFGGGGAGGGSGGATALTSPPDYSLAMLLAQQQGQQNRRPLGGPQIPPVTQRNIMGGQSAPDLGPPRVGGTSPGGVSSTPTGMSGLLSGMDPAKARSLLQSLGLGDSANSFGGGNGGPIFDLGKALGINLGTPGYSGGGPLADIGAGALGSGIDDFGGVFGGLGGLFGLR